MQAIAIQFAFLPISISSCLLLWFLVAGSEASSEVEHEQVAKWCYVHRLIMYKIQELWAEAVGDLLKHLDGVDKQQHSSGNVDYLAHRCKRSEAHEWERHGRTGGSSVFNWSAWIGPMPWPNLPNLRPWTPPTWE